MALFQHEDFIFLGMMWAKYFQGFQYDFSGGTPAGGTWTGGGGGYFPDEIPLYGTGRGGIIENGSPSNGDDGRPGASDSITGPAVPSLAGGRGTLTSPGGGFNYGGFGYGGRAQLITHFGYTTSAGGGSGWFGGGSAYIDAGGGGGSNFCLSNNIYAESGIEAAVEAAGSYNIPSWLEGGLWVGVDGVTTQHYLDNTELYTTNTRHLSEYEGLRRNLGPAYGAFISLRNQADGNGMCLISEPNKLITINRTAGSIDNIGTIVEYSGNVFKWTPTVEGDYHFILWGAQGGTVRYEPETSDLYQSYVGGFGGAIGGIFHLAPTHKEVQQTGEEIDVETVIGVYVGERGVTRSLYNTYNGGGNAGKGGSSSGGGATDLRWDSLSGWQANLNRRFLVAGGGGGCIGANYGDSPVLPTEPGGYGDVVEDGNIRVPKDGPIKFLVNDRSLVYVTIQYYTSSLLPDNADLSCTLYINNGNEGVLYQKFGITPVNGVAELVYELDQVYPPNTQTHWVGLSVDIKTNVMFIIPNGGLNIRVETRAGVNEPNSDWENKEPPLFNIRHDIINLLSSIRASLTSPPGDEYLRFKTELALLSKVRTKIKDIQKVYVRVNTDLGLTNTVGAELKSIIIPDDAFIRANTTLEVINNIQTRLVEIQKSGLYSKTDLELSSSINVILKKIDKVKLSMQTDLELSSSIKEERTDG